MFEPHAKPGTWFISYHSAWTEAHPGAFIRGEMKSGGFHKGNVWVTYTPEWDRNWFKEQGMKMPWRWHKQTQKPIGIPIASMMPPGGSVTFDLGLSSE